MCISELYLFCNVLKASSTLSAGIILGAIDYLYMVAKVALPVQ